ncbi:MAG TPA: hypothetical protein VFG05_10290 [Methylocella sp.]|nr:hypothetical protein [Methylocella sp.]
MSHDPHYGYIIAAYALAFVVLAGMTGATLADYVLLKRALLPFEGERKPQEIAGKESGCDEKPGGGRSEGAG